MLFLGGKALIRRLCTDCIEEAEVQLRSAITLVNNKGLEVEDLTLGSDQHVTSMDVGHKAVLLRLDTIVYLSQFLQQIISTE